MECHATVYGFLRLWYKYELRKYSHYVIFTFRAINTFLLNSCTPILAKCASDKTREISDLKFYTTNIGMHSLLHDIPRFLFLFLEELFLIFNQMLSIQAFGRRVAVEPIDKGKSKSQDL